MRKHESVHVCDLRHKEKGRHDLQLVSGVASAIAINSEPVSQKLLTYSMSETNLDSKLTAYKVQAQAEDVTKFGRCCQNRHEA